MFRLRVSFILLVCYWGALFIATHLPLMQSTRRALPKDKLLHFGGYCVLAMLLAWTACGRRRFTFKLAAVLLLVLAVYGGIDEITQQFLPPRTSDLNDWYADIAGSIVGIGLFFLGHTLAGKPKLSRQQEVSR